jgi:toxin FitB
MYTLDTNAIIYYVQDDAHAVATLETIYMRGVPVYVSVMTEAELFAFAHISSEESGRIEQFLKTVSIIPMDSQIARLTATVRKTYQLKIADSVIAATALFTGTRLVTRNTQDFEKVSQLVVEKI